MKRFFTVLLTFAAFTLFAQQRDSVYFEPLKRNDLKPIVIDRGRYYYGNQRLKSAYSLEIPFYELNNAATNQYFKQFKTLRTVGTVVVMIPTAYFFYTVGGGNYNRTTFWAFYATGLAGSMFFNLLAETKMRRAVQVFNGGISRNRFGFSGQPLPNQTVAWGVAYRRSF